MRFLERYDVKDTRFVTSEANEFYATVWGLKLLTLADVAGKRPKKARKRRKKHERQRG